MQFNEDSNAAILFYKENILQFFIEQEEDEIYLKYLNFLCKNGKLSLDFIENPNKFDPKKINFKLRIAQFSTDNFIRFLTNLNIENAKNLKNKLNNFVPDFIECIQDSLKHKFETSTFIPFDKDSTNLPIDDILLPTKYTEFNANNGKKFIDTDFIDDLKVPFRCLFIGNAGSGKTSHFKKLVHCWCKTKDILQEYIFLPLNLDTMNHKKFEKNIWNEIFDKEPNDDDLSILQFILGLEKVVFLFDGLDEFSDHFSIV